MEYREEIDGLRAVAILAVLLYHVKLFSMTGGYLGVDVFFVISGYLISSLLFAEAEATGTVSLSNFYLRRSRRILPALFVVLAATFLPIHWLISTTPAYVEYAQSLPAAALSVANVFFWRTSGYFAVEAMQSPLLHTWTLGVEEQFYLVIPVIILLFAKRRSPDVTRKILFFSALALLSFLFCRYGKRFWGPYFLFYMLPGRMWELLLGVVAALVWKRHNALWRSRPRLCDAVSFAGLGIVLAAFRLYHESIAFAEKALVVSAATACILCFSSGGPLFRALLGAAPARFIGNISYSMYLWHWPLITIAFFLSIRHGLEETALSKALIVAATLLLSTLSWKYVEKPLRRLRTWRALARPLSLHAGAAAGVCALALFTAGSTQRPYALDNDQLPTEIPLARLKDGTAFHLGAPGGREQFILIGDSHARCASRALDILANSHAVAGLAATYANTLPTPSFRNADIDIGQELAQSWLDLIAQKNIRHVVIACNWSSLTVGKFYHNGKALPQAAVIPTFVQEFAKTARLLIARGCEVWLVNQVPSWRRDPVLAANLNAAYREVPDRGIRDELFAALAREIQSPHLHLLDPWDALLDNGLLLPVKDGKLAYIDSNHVSQDGVRRMVNVFTPFFESLARPEQAAAAPTPAAAHAALAAGSLYSVTQGAPASLP